ncbi:hypothetical protein [Marispirochaeta sp.]|jgi:hypothetical protein|uniref:hypothetical protein n=1 Tax=Marispirochaeta sp. TaxID=2038653 RepID=UPI0029C94554|nr:hypothetical protein [Marispirochaeta sp.]
MMRRPWLFLVEFVWEILRLALIFNLVALMANREGFFDTAAVLFLLGVPGIIYPAGVLSLFFEADNSGLRLLLVLGKGMMVLTEGLLLILVSVLGAVLAQFFPALLSLRLPASLAPAVFILLTADLLFFFLLLLFKLSRPGFVKKGIPEPPIVEIKEE